MPGRWRVRVPRVYQPLPYADRLGRAGVKGSGWEGKLGTDRGNRYTSGGALQATIESDNGQEARQWAIRGEGRARGESLEGVKGWGEAVKGCGEGVGEGQVRRGVRAPKPVGAAATLVLAFRPEVAPYVRPAVNGSEVAGSITCKPQLDRPLSTANKLYRSLSEAREYSLMGSPGATWNACDPRRFRVC